MSRTDPDATMARKGGGGQTCLRYHHHRALDDAHGVIVAVETTTGSVPEASRLESLVLQGQSHTERKCRTVVADRIYGTNHNFVALGEAGINTHMADLSQTVVNQRSQGIYGDEHFVFDAQANTYTCPAGQLLKPRAFHALKRTWEYAPKRGVCAACALRTQCTRSRYERTLRRHEKHELLRRARAQSRSRAARRDRRRRMHLMEQSFADAANHHGFKRSRWRRLWRQRIQDWLIATAQNLRILVRARPLRPVASAAQSLEVPPMSVVTAIKAFVIRLLHLPHFPRQSF
jgi:hypothetical protein